MKVQKVKLNKYKQKTEDKTVLRYTKLFNKAGIPLGLIFLILKNLTLPILKMTLF